MCGLAGILMRDRDAQPEVGQAQRMADSMWHRGPDAGGHWAEGPVALGHRRLRIIDLTERGSQPMVSADGRFVLIYNGEIYNYRELRSELEAAGITFRSTSDTEVLLNGFAIHGASILERLNGIFAFALWDRREKKLFAARDPMGVKPLYYALEADRLLFVSEIKALGEAGWRFELDRERVGEFLTFGAVAGEFTPFLNVRRLLPGGWLSLRPGESLKVGRYSDMLRCSSGSGEIDDEGVVEGVRSRLATAVDRQLISDVPVGAMCSGGVDSSALTALSALRSAGINTFCVKVPGARYDESAFAREVSLHCSTKHHELESGPDDVGELLPSLVWLHDEPLMHPNSVAIFQIYNWNFTLS